MTMRDMLVLLHLLGWLAFLLAGAFAAMNVVHASRRTMRGEGRPPIPILVTVMGLAGLRTLAFTLHRPGLFGFWPALLVILVDVGSWLLPPIVCEMLGFAGSGRSVVGPPLPPPGPPPPPPPGSPSPFARPPRPPAPPRER
jgi:hypothetical protein